MRCPLCSHENLADRESCERCGRPLERICAACGRGIPIRFTFCGHCGAGQVSQPSAAAPSAIRQESGAELGPRSAERRQLTVLFCDLVGSTALAERLDPEDLRDVMHLYQAICAEVVARFGGEVAEFAGDGVVVCFGHPQVYEDAAERAVRAGLALTQAVGRLQVPSRLHVRIGIATGLVIVGDLIEAGGLRQRELVGSPPNLAARLQKIAAPDTVVVSASTRNVIGDVFTYDDLGRHHLEGFSAEVQAFAVVGENVAADRFEARTGAALLPLANREAERALLRERWRRAQDGQGQVVLLSGDPGIGKSRLVRDLRDQLAGEAHGYLIFGGSRLHQNTPLHPVAHWLRRAAGIEPDDTTIERHTKLESLLATTGSHEADGLTLIAELVGVPAACEGSAPKLAPQRRKERLLEVLLDLLDAHAARRPVLLVFEDMQWIDATTHELLDRMVRRIERLRVLLLVTFRTGTSVPWHGLPHVTTQVLVPLDPPSCVSVIGAILRNRALPSRITEQIIARTDGVPLFVEELTRAVLESHDGLGAVGTAAPFVVPETLRDTLMARLDRSEDVRSVAQIAAAIGREFPYELLAMIAPMPAAALQVALSELLQSGLISEHGVPPRATYVFKHALVQEIAYSSQLRRRRRSIHEQIAATLEKHFPETPPEVVGHHYAEAGATRQAIVEFERAAGIARSRSANAEAAAHFERALQLLEGLPANAARDRRELELQIAYGAQLIAVKGNAAAEVGKAYDRAMTLSNALGDTRPILRVLRGLQTFYIVRGRLAKAHAIGQRLVEEAERDAEPDRLLQAHRPHGLCLLCMGELTAAQHHLERAIALYDPVRHAQHRFLYGSDPGVLARCNLAWVEWFLGCPERALASSEAALSLAERPEPHPHSQAFALSLAASLHQFRAEPDEARRLAEAVIDLADRHRFAYWGPWGHVVRGWARVMTGGGAAGVHEVASGLEAYRATGAALMGPYFLGLLADVLGRVGRTGDGLAAVDEALELARTGDIRFYEPELRRLRAEFLAAARAPADEPIGCLERALAQAGEQGSRSLELRVAITLCRLSPEPPGRSRALDRLRAVVAEFGEGLESSAMHEARAILDAAPER